MSIPCGCSSHGGLGSLRPARLLNYQRSEVFRQILEVLSVVHKEIMVFSVFYSFSLVNKEELRLV